MLTLRSSVIGLFVLLTGCVGYGYQPVGYGYGGYPGGYAQPYAPAYIAPPVRVVVPVVARGPWNHQMSRPYYHEHHRV